MGGWSLVYNLINFAILAAVLYFFGRKIVAKSYRDHRSRIQNGLEQSAASLENAETLRGDLEKAKVSGEKERAEILAAAETAAADNSRRAGKEDEAAAAQLFAETQKDLDHEALRLRRELREQAAEEIAGSAGELIAREENAAARERLSAQFLDWFCGQLEISRGDALSFRESESVALTIRAAAEPDGESVARIRAAAEEALQKAGIEKPVQTKVLTD